MPIPRTWSEELVSEWLCLKGYSTEIGIPAGKGNRGGRAEADVVGIRINESKTKTKVLEIYHVEIGQLRGYEDNIDMLKKKFSNTRTTEIKNRYKKRMAVKGNVQYYKLYIDIWDRPELIKKLMDNVEIASARIEIWTPNELFCEIFSAIKDWDKSTDESTIPESYWMLKLLESLKWNTKLIQI
jgi:hypothetical protein